MDRVCCILLGFGEVSGKSKLPASAVEPGAVVFAAVSRNTEWCQFSGGNSRSADARCSLHVK